MALDIVVTTSRWKNDPTSRALVGFLEQHQVDLGLSDGVVYYDFPAYAGYEASVFRPDLLLLSPSHGFVAIRAFDPGMVGKLAEGLRTIDAALGDFVEQPALQAHSQPGIAQKAEPTPSSTSTLSSF